MPPASQDLITTVSEYIRAWRRMSRVYALISILLRGTLIVASAIVAAKLGLKDIFHDITFSVLSVVVAAGTALEAWLKLYDGLRERRRSLYAFGKHRFFRLEAN